MINVLVVEDERQINELVCVYLKGEGYNPCACYDGAEGFKRFLEGDIDVIISDIMMPVMDGYQFAIKVREVNEEVPIIFLTAKDDKPSKQLGYKLGVDDYMTKPFDVDELMLKIKAILRRSSVKKSKKLEVGNLVLDLDEHTAYVDGEELNFTVREFDVLYKFLSYPKKTFTRSKLMDEFWGFDSSATSRTVDVCIVKLREKTAICDGFEIVTVHGLGYKAVLK